MLIGSNGEKFGLITLSEALESARAASLDLVQVSPPDTQPIVCKLLDYGKYLFDKKKAFRHPKLKLREIQQKRLNSDLPLI